MPERDVDWARAKEVFGELLDEPTESRAAALDRLVGDDEALRAAVDGLLAARDDSDDFLSETDDAPAETHDLPTRIGPYEPHEILGEGGFGVVFRATQHEPVEREVAIKLLKPGLGTSAMVRRFEVERNVLARMEHPGIAKLLDAGTAPDGRSYVVMELVRGPSIVEYCRTNDLVVRERVALMARACRAIHHAHQRAVIHRDIKPPNILVTEVDGQPEPRIIDFGIAKVVSEAQEEDHTQVGDILGTPRYMSPEQLTGEGVADTRVDVYALGVVLCQTLTGAVPRSGRTMTARPLRETTAERPSRLAATDDAGTPPAAAVDLARTLRGDLDRIVLKCVQWEPDQRYDSAAALADELDRYLRGEPVLAAGPGVVYRTGKFLRRHRLATSLVAVAVMSLVLGTVLALAGLKRALEQEHEAARQADRAEFVGQFLLTDILEAMNPDVTRGRDVSVGELLDVAADRASDRFADDPELHVDVLRRLGLAYKALMRWEDAAAVFEQAVAIAEASDADPALLLELRIELAFQLITSQRHEEGFPLRERNRADAIAQLGPTHPITLRARLHASTLQRDPEALLAELDAVMAELEAQRRIDGEDYLAALGRRAVALTDLSRHEDALEMRRAAEALARRIYGRHHSKYLDALGSFVGKLISMQRAEEAEPHVVELVELTEVMHGAESGAMVIPLYRYVNTMRHLRRIDDAHAAVERALRLATAEWGQDSVPYSTALSMFGASLLDVGRPDEGIAALEQALVLRREQWGERSEYVGSVLQSLARGHLLVGDPERALERIDAAIERLRTVPDLSRARVTRAKALHRLGRAKEAEAFLLEAMKEAGAARVDPWTFGLMQTAYDEMTGR